MARTFLKSVEAPPTAFETDSSEQNAASKSCEDFSFEIWREIFKVIAAGEKKALETGVTVQFMLEVTQCGGRARAPIVTVDLVCEPGQPARAVSALRGCDIPAHQPEVPRPRWGRAPSK